MPTTSLLPISLPHADGQLLRDKISRAFDAARHYLRRQRTNRLLDLTEHQLRDIGADPAFVARVADMRSLHSFRGPGGKIWVQLMYRGPGI